MTREVTNLRVFKKKKLRQEKEDLAAANREKFGRTKAQKTNHKRDEKRSYDNLSGKKINRTDTDT